MTNRLMMSVAAIALLAGTSFASAQGMNREGGGATAAPQAAPSGEHAAPSAAPAHAAPSAAPMNHAAPAGGAGMKAESTERPAQPNGAAPAERAQNNAQPAEKGAPVRENAENNNGNRAGEKAAESRDNNANRGGVNTETKSASDKSTTETRSQTVGQAGAGAKITTEQRTKITSVIREQHVQPLTHVNFSISIGTRVPRETSFHPLPTEIITYYPEWRGYEYVLVNDQILVIDPRTYEIVAVLDA